VDPHHIDADPDSTYYPDADPDSDFYLMRIRIRIQLFYPDADPVPDPDPSFQIKVQTLTYILACHLQTNAGPNPLPDQAHHVDADPVTKLKGIHADPDPQHWYKVWLTCESLRPAKSHGAKMCIEVLGWEAAALAAAEHPHVPAAAASPAHRHVHPTLGGGLADLHTHSLRD
jgi:hypothetical protein